MRAGRVFKTIIGTVLLFGVYFVLQQGPLLLGKVSKFPINFSSTSTGIYTIDLSSLGPGHYYLSLGRILGNVEIRLNGALIQRAQLIAGIPIDITNGQSKQTLTIECFSKELWRQRLFEVPIVTSYGIGLLIQEWRIFNGVFMGPIASLLLVLMALFYSRLTKNASRQVMPHFVLGVVGFLYSFYLSGITDLFFDPTTNTVVQIELRVLFAAALIYLMSTYVGKKYLRIQMLNVVCLLAAVLVGYFKRAWLTHVYEAELAFFGVATLALSIDLYKKASRTAELNLMVCLGFSWSILQIFAVICHYFFFVSNMTVWSPSFIATLAGFNFYFIYRKGVSHSAEMELSKRQYLLASQIAHDVRSPLALLKVLSRDEAMPDDLKGLLVAASDRIRGIADTLLEQNRELKTKQPVNSKVLFPKAKKSNLVELISKNVEEKKRLTNKVQIHFNHNSEGHLSAEVDPLEFSRLLSNLIDNAIEAVDASGEITITLLRESDEVLLSIKDNGRGIPDQMLSKLFEYGATFGKSNGNGLGLYSAKKAIEGWGGTIKINSLLGHGSEVVINLPGSDV